MTALNRNQKTGVQLPPRGPLTCCMFPRIFWPSRWISLVTTWGYLLLMEFRAPLGSLASSESRTAWTVVARFMWVSASTWSITKPAANGKMWDKCVHLTAYASIKMNGANMWTFYNVMNVQFKCLSSIGVTGSSPISLKNLNQDFWWVFIFSLSLKYLTTPIKSPRPYSPASSFFPSSFAMTERSRPLSTIKVLSDLSPCLKQKNKKCKITHTSLMRILCIFFFKITYNVRDFCNNRIK